MSKSKMSEIEEKRKKYYGNLDDHQIRRLEKYYEVNHENKIVHLEVKKHKASDLYEETSFGVSPHFSRDIALHLVEEIETFPKSYSADIKFHVDDYENRSADDMKDDFIDQLKYLNYPHVRERKWRWIIHGFSISLALIVLLFNAIMVANKWWGNDLRSDLWTQVVNLVCGVMIWEAFNILFISPNKVKRVGLLLVKHLHSVSFVSRGGKTLSLLDEQDVRALFVQELAINRFIKGSGMFVSAVLLGLSITHVYTSVITVAAHLNDINKGIANIVCNIGISVACFVCSIVGTASFAEKKNFIAYAAIPVFLTSLAICITSVVFAVFIKDFNLLIGSIVILIFISFYVITRLIGEIYQRVSVRKVEE